VSPLICNPRRPDGEALLRSRRKLGSNRRRGRPALPLLFRFSVLYDKDDPAAAAGGSWQGLRSTAMAVMRNSPSGCGYRLISTGVNLRPLNVLVDLMHGLPDQTEFDPTGRGAS